MPIKSIYRVLFFIDGMAPTSLQRSEALNFGPHVSFRNAQHINDADNPEYCNAVYGEHVPPRYASKFPWACSIVDYYAGKLDPAPMASGAVVDADEAPAPADAPDFDPFAPGASPDGNAAWNKQG